jgi:hypothetical protein
LPLLVKDLPIGRVVNLQPNLDGICNEYGLRGASRMSISLISTADGFFSMARDLAAWARLSGSAVASVPERSRALA